MRGWQWWHLILISRVSGILFARSVKNYYSDDERPSLGFVGPCKRFCPVKSICQSWRKVSLFGQLMWELTQPPHVTKCSQSVPVHFSVNLQRDKT